MAVILGLIFEPGDDAAGFQNKAGSLNFILYFFGFCGMSMLAAVAEDWSLFWREHHAGLYGAALHVRAPSALTSTWRAHASTSQRTCGGPWRVLGHVPRAVAR